MVARVLDSVKRYVTFAASQVNADPLECADLSAFGSSDLSQYSPVKSVPRKECSADCRWPKQCQIAALQNLRGPQVTSRKYFFKVTRKLVAGLL